MVLLISCAAQPEDVPIFTEQAAEEQAKLLEADAMNIARRADESVNEIVTELEAELNTVIARPHRGQVEE